MSAHSEENIFCTRVTGSVRRNVHGNYSRLVPGISRTTYLIDRCTGAWRMSLGCYNKGRILSLLVCCRQVSTSRWLNGNFPLDYAWSVQVSSSQKQELPSAWLFCYPNRTGYYARRPVQEDVDILESFQAPYRIRIDRPAHV